MIAAMPNLCGKVCLVTGASRGIGRGIALQLATNGAKCYITGRSITRLEPVQKEAIERGVVGEVIPVECDHTSDDNIEELFKKITAENDGQLDMLVNNAYSGLNCLIENINKNFWDMSVDCWDEINNVGLRNHYICAVYASRLMVPRRKGIILNISASGGLTYFQNPAYGIGKCAKDRMAKDCSMDLAKYNVAFLSIWPGAVRTETVMDQINKPESKDAQLGHYEINWLFDHGESTEYSGKCISHLLLDPNIMQKTGKVILTGDLASEYNVMDVDGKYPLNIRSIQLALAASGHMWLVKYVPSWLKIPRWLFMLILPLVSKIDPKKPSSYAGSAATA